MRIHTGLLALLMVSTGCIAYSDGDGGRGGRSDAEARAEKHCEREAEQRGLRVERVGDAEKVGKKEYEVRLRVDDRRYERSDDKRGKKKDKDDDLRVVCRYDDKSRRASIY
jgi:hypothetical protein